MPPRNAVPAVFEPFAQEVTKALSAHCPQPMTAPNQDPNDPINAAFLSLDSLGQRIVPTLHKSNCPLPYITLVSNLLPYICSWISYLLEYNVIMQREDDLWHDFTFTSISLVQRILASTSELRKQTLMISVPGPFEGESSFFVANLITRHLFVDNVTLLQNHHHRAYLICFKILDTLVCSEKDSQVLQTIAQAVLNQPAVFASTFMAELNDQLYRLRTADSFDELSTCLDALDKEMTVSWFFWNKDEKLAREFSLRGFVSWANMLLVSIASSRTLRYIRDAVDSNPKAPVLSTACNCVTSVTNHHQSLFLTIGHITVRKFHESEAFIRLLRFGHFLYSHPGVQDSRRQQYLGVIRVIFELMTPFLQYYSVFKAARFSQRRVERSIPQEELALIGMHWEKYQRRMNEMEGYRAEYKAHPYTICHNAQCPNLESKGIRSQSCSGCGLNFYCSETCQRAAWPSHKQSDGIRLSCADLQKALAIDYSALSTVDMYFFGFIFREGLKTLGEDEPQLLRTLNLGANPEPHFALQVVSLPHEAEVYASRYVRARKENELTALFSLPGAINGLEQAIDTKPVFHYEYEALWREGLVFRLEMFE